MRLDGLLTSKRGLFDFGGAGDDAVFGIAIHPQSGHVYAAGQTNSVALPGTSGAAQGSKGSDGVRHAAAGAPDQVTRTDLHVGSATAPFLVTTGNPLAEAVRSTSTATERRMH